ncbi:hypothetical protein [Thalassotalea ganghwensis]
MKTLIQSKTFIGALTAVSISFVSAWGIATAHDAHLGFNQDIAGIASAPFIQSGFYSDRDGYIITVTHEDDLDKKHYLVNGVSFYWKDLTKEQQQQLSVYEKELSQIEDYFQDKDGEFAKLMQEVDQKAAAIEEQMKHLEDMKFTLDSKEVTLRDLEKIGEQISKKMEGFELALEKKNLDLSSLEQALDKMELEKLDGIDDVAKEYEQLLLNIAEQRKAL